MISLSSQLVDDCTVMLDRVLTGESLTFFGEDGGGQYGRSVFPKTCRIRSFNVDIERYSDDYAEIVAYVYIFLDDYSASEHGHAITDANLRIDLNRLLAKEEVDPTALDWGELEKQDEDYIVLKIDVQKLLAW